MATQHSAPNGTANSPVTAPPLLRGFRVGRWRTAARLMAAGLWLPTAALWAAPLAPAGQPAAAAPLRSAAAPSARDAGTAPQGCAPLLNHVFERLQDEKPQSLCQYSGRVVLVVNTASFCGFTGQYEGLEALYARYKDRGLVVLGFPANDFGRQEPGSNRAIAAFCENTFGVRFPMFGKTRVVGPEAHALFRQLAQRTGQAPQWNFHKYLLARDGQGVRSYPSATEPNNPDLIRDIEKNLSTKM